MISRLLKALLLIYALVGLIQFSKAQDSGKVVLTYPEFDFFAKALVERNHLSLDTARLLFAQKALLNVIREQYHQKRLDSLSNEQMSLALDHVQKVNAGLQRDVKKATKAKVFWRGLAGLTGAAVIVETVILLTKRE